jgi:CHAT domain-containing protein/tetratricopeptide (TPR) repeat protein
MRGRGLRMVATSHSHKTDIGAGLGARRLRDLHRRRARARLAAALAICAASSAWAAPAFARAGNASCTQALGAPVVSLNPVRTLGTQPATVDLALTAGHTYLVEVAERDNDALVAVLGRRGEVLAESDHPERRTGTRRAVVTVSQAGIITVRVTGKEQANAAGTATVRVFDLARLDEQPKCLAVMKTLAAADADYAAGQAISRGLTSSAGSAHGLFLSAAESYSAADQALVAPTDELLRGQTQLALAGVEYLGLQDWALAASWAQQAAATLAIADPYRHARAETLLAESWIEIGRRAPLHPGLQSGAVVSGDLLTRARTMLQTQSHFHLQRGEKYDAAFDFSNIALTYLYQAKFQQCVVASTVSSRLFAAIRDTSWRALAWQNTALCYWGLGRIPDARQLLERAMRDIGPQPYPAHYLLVINNTALADYALGDFDESLRLFDRALSFARLTQSHRDEGQTLYGIGIDYYALGDSTLAREFLTRSLAIRTVALDRRGRMATLRALATVDADDGRLEEAMANEREALALAIAPASVERIKIQLAVDTAAEGHLDEAKAQLDAVLANAEMTDPAIRAEGLLQRGVLLRKMGRGRDALADLAEARPRLHRLGNSTEEFAVNLELARTWRLAGHPREALAAVNDALQKADAVRLQSASPEFRMRLQAPLRAAYDLKIELLRARYEDALTTGQEQEANELAAAAFATADASRARSLADVAAQEYSPAVRRDLAPEFRRRESLYEELAGRQFILESHFDHAGSADARTRHLMDDIAEIERQLDTLNTLIASRAGVGVEHQSANRGTGSLPSLPPDTALIAYWLGAESAYAWVVLPHAIHWTRLSSSREISNLAIDLHRALSRFVDSREVEVRLQDSRMLSEQVLAPIDSQFRNVTQWVFIPDGALDYVPFAALRASADGADAFVVAQHDIAVTPAAWMLDTQNDHALPRPPTLLLVADPVYQAGDPRLASLRSSVRVIPTSERRRSDSVRRDYQRLPFTAEEATAVAAEFPNGSVDELIGLDATRARLLSLDWSKYRFIHIATHGIVNAQVPELSALMLGSYDARGDLVDDSAVRMADLSLRELRAQVVVFSACDTALGKEVPSEGLVGISSTVLARGAKAVVASLWPVSDEIGASLMTELYRHMLRDSMSVPAALGAAMRSALSRNGSADPALWAAFQASVVALGPGLPVRDGNTATTTRP